WSASGSCGAPGFFGGNRFGGGRRCGVPPPRRGIGRAADHDPALSLGKPPALLDPHRIALAVAVGLVMRRVLLRAGDEFIVQRVHDAPLDAHDHRLVASVADDDPLEYPFRHLALSL